MSELTERERWRVGSRVRVPVRAPLPVAAVVAATCASSGFVPTLPPPLRATSHHSPLFAFSFHTSFHSPSPHTSLAASLPYKHTRAHTRTDTPISSHPSYSELLHLLLPCIIIFVTISITTIHLHLPLSRISTNSNFRRWSLDGIIDDASQQHARILSLFPTLSSCPSTPSTSFLPSFLLSFLHLSSLSPALALSLPLSSPFILSLYDELSGCLTVLGPPLNHPTSHSPLFSPFHIHRTKPPNLVGFRIEAPGMMAGMSELTERERWRCFASARIAQSVEHQTFNLRVQGSSPCSGAFTGGGCSCCNLRLVGFCAYTSTAAEGHFAPLASPSPHTSLAASLPYKHTRAHTRTDTHLISSLLLRTPPSPPPLHHHFRHHLHHHHPPASTALAYIHKLQLSPLVLDGIIDDASQQHARILSLPYPLLLPLHPLHFLPSFLPSFLPPPQFPLARARALTPTFLPPSSSHSMMN
ncbi:hypothetical protein Aperf_G00000129940 [Anoplocephala perfoliata]